MGHSYSSNRKFIDPSVLSRDYTLLNERHISPTLPEHQLYARNSSRDNLLVKFNRSLQLQDSQDLLKLRETISGLNLLNVMWSQQSSAMCSSQTPLTFYSQFYNDNLSAQISKKKLQGVPFNTEDITNVALQSLKALQSMHLHGYYHGYLCPDNIHFSPDGKLKILDSRLITGEDSFSLASKTKIPKFLSPSQMNSYELKSISAKDRKQQSDIYQLGLTLLEMMELDSHQQIYSGGRDGINNKLQKKFQGLQKRYPYELVDKVRMMLKENELQRKSAQSLYKMFQRMSTRKQQTQAIGLDKYPLVQSYLPK